MWSNTRRNNHWTTKFFRKLISEDPNVAISQDIEIMKYMSGGMSFEYLDNLDASDAQHVRYHALARMKEEERKAHEEGNQ